MTVRPEQSDDLDAIRAVNRDAFDGEGEGRLVDRLRREGLLRLSLVAATEQLSGELIYPDAFAEV